MDLTKIIEREGGRITFAEFMDLALYHPQKGFYRAGQVQFGDKGDFITHPDLCSPYFARALVRQIASMWNLMGRPTRFQLIEMGSGDGTLVRDMLRESELEFPGFLEALDIVLIDISPQLVRRQQAKIPSKYHKKIEFIQGSVMDHTWQEVTGCILSNELFDALPVHKVTMVDGALAEVYVIWNDKDETFEEIYGKVSNLEINKYFDRLGIHLNDNEEFYVNLHAVNLVKNISLAINSGYHIAIDYGTTADHMMQEKLSKVYTFKKHIRGTYPYKDINRKDITSTVDFSSLILSGNEEGLNKHLYLDEYRFFKHWLGWKRDFDSGYEASKILDHFFSDGFKVLIQGKNVPELN